MVGDFFPPADLSYVFIGLGLHARRARHLALAQLDRHARSRPYGTERMIDALLETRLRARLQDRDHRRRHRARDAAARAQETHDEPHGRRHGQRRRRQLRAGLQKELGVLPPGDIRNCLVALADDEALVTDLFRYRFTEGDGLTGHSFGNLFLAAMTGITGNFDDAIKVSSRVLNIKGPRAAGDARRRAAVREARATARSSKANRTSRNRARRSTTSTSIRPARSRSTK